MVRSLTAPHRAVALGLLLALVASCRSEAPAPPRPRDELQTVEVAPPPDVRVDPSRDVQERRRAEDFSGVLPGGFPPGLPLPRGASLVDQGGAWVELLVGRRLETVGGELEQGAAKAGWQVREVTAGSLELARDGRVVRVRLSAAGPSTRLRVDYSR